MSILSFDPDNTLAGGLYAMTPREAIALGVALCEAVERVVGPDGCHGAVWPGNVTAADGQIAIGPERSGSVAGLEPDALEFVAPEQFWNGSASPASDVYSIGLILYTALNDGVMPFFSADAEHTPETRAYALQNRMKGAPLPYPRSAGRELSSVIEKAIAFQAEDRYPKPAALKLALQSLPEGAAVPAVAPVIPLTRAEVENAHSYKVDKDFEQLSPDRPRKPQQPRRQRGDGEVDENMDAGEFRKTPKKRGRWILPLILILLIAAAAVLLLRSCRDYYDPTFPISTPDTQQPALTDNPIHPPVPTESPVPVATEAPTPTPEPTPEPTDHPKYEIYVDNVSWEQAKKLCEDKGGHLATVRTDEELAEIISLAESKGATYVWLGAYRATNSHWYYVTGDALSYTKWDAGEPSAADMDGTREDYLLLWYRANNATWSYNDMRNDPIAVAPGYRGRLAYICQYD